MPHFRGKKKSHLVIPYSSFYSNFLRVIKLTILKNLPTVSLQNRIKNVEDVILDNLPIIQSCGFSSHFLTVL